MLRIRHRHTTVRLLAGMLILGILLMSGACSPSTEDTLPVDSSNQNSSNTDETVPSADGITVTPEILRRQGYFQDTLFTFTTQSSNQMLEGLMQADGTILIPAEYEEVRPLTAERFLAKTKDGSVLLNREGKALLTAAFLHSFDGLRNAQGVYEEDVLIAAAKREGDLLTEWSLADLDGQTIGTAVWDVLEFHSKGYIHAVRDQKDYLIDYQSTIVVDFTNEVFVAPSEKANPLQKTERIQTLYNGVGGMIDSRSHFGVQTSSGDTVLPTDYDRVTILSPTRIAAQLGTTAVDMTTSFLMDETGQILSDGEYNTIHFYPASESAYSAVGIAYLYDLDTDTSCYYLIDQDGNRAIDQPFEELSFTDDNRITAKQNGETFTMDLEGNRID